MNSSSLLLHPSQFPAGIFQPRMFAATTELALGDLYYSSGGTNFVRLPIGTSGQRLIVSNGVPSWSLEEGASGTVTLAKITGGGANGSLTVVNGIITSITNPT